MEQDTVGAIKSRLNIADIVRRYVELRPAGARLVAPCPFHQETKPSFSVNPDEGFYYCFGCQASGDLIDFYMRINGLEFKEALAQLAAEAGVEMTRSRPNPEVDKQRKERKLCLSMYSWAQRRFAQNLRSPDGEQAREYLKARGITGEIALAFGMGWAKDEWHDLDNYLRAKGFAKNDIVSCGLLKENKGNNYDMFRGRVTFPIMNLSNQVIAFGGRILTSDGPKYINSSDSVVYKKGEHLYGLSQARKSIAQTRHALLTEGYMDVISLHQFGYTNACGVLGTALTTQQVQRLSGFCNQVDLKF